EGMFCDTLAYGGLQMDLEHRDDICALIGISPNNIILISSMTKKILLSKYSYPIYRCLNPQRSKPDTRWIKRWPASQTARAK
ncbi:hypothetical protein J6590_042673, partial [Homalodisca vitripennis]